MRSRWVTNEASTCSSTPIASGVSQSSQAVTSSTVRLGLSIIELRVSVSKSGFRDRLKDDIKELAVYRFRKLLKSIRNVQGRDQMTQTINLARRYRVLIFVSRSNSLQHRTFRACRLARAIYFSLKVLIISMSTRGARPSEPISDTSLDTGHLQRQLTS